MPDLAVTALAGAEDLDVIVVGPSLGTSVAALWAGCAARLGDRFAVLGWDLPGHGRSRPATAPFTVADLAADVRDLVGPVVGDRRACYAGVSLGGAVGLALALDPGPFSAIAVLASAPTIGDPTSWHERAELVRRGGTSAMLTRSAVTWFAPGFVDRCPQVAAGLLTSLSEADRASYAWACEALADLDLRARMGEVAVPVLLAAGAHDEVVPPEVAACEAAGIPGAQLRVLGASGHLPPAEEPEAVAAMLTEFVTRRGGLR